LKLEGPESASSDEQTRDRTRSETQDIRESGLEDLERIVADAGERSFRAKQLAGWIYSRGIESFDAMLDLSKGFREHLKHHFKIGSGATATVARSSDGTRKLLVGLGDGEAIESVVIPSREVEATPAGDKLNQRITLCMSSQAGCAMACEFCATARMGLHRNLTVSEILSQVFLSRKELAADEHLTNYVFMGMGEPLANYPRLIKALTIMTSEWGMGISPRRITVSTVGIVPMMERLLTEVPVRIAVSLHATTDELRDRLAPINKRYPLEVLLEACKRLPMKQRERITFEYVMLRGVNDSIDDAKRLVKLLMPLRGKVNLIFFNAFDGSGFATSPRAAVEDFQAILRKGNLTATIRESRGLDIAAACGQLYAEQTSTG
jgi:23S rRNA (adenine2503-C2)-methyltransferase